MRALIYETASIVLTTISWITGRAIWYDLAARLAARAGDHAGATEMRNAALRERLKKGR